MTIVWIAAGFLAGLLLGATSVNVGWNNEINQEFKDVQILGIVKGKHAELLSGGTYYTSNSMHMVIDFRIDHFNTDLTMAINADGEKVSVDKLYTEAKYVPQK